MLERLTGAAAARPTPAAAAPTVPSATWHQKWAGGMLMTQEENRAAAAPPAHHPLSPASDSPGGGEGHEGQRNPLPASAEELAVWRLEHALVRSGSAAEVTSACNELLSPDAAFSWALGRASGRGAIARYFQVLQLLFVDDATLDAVAVADVPVSSSLFLQAAFAPRPSQFAAPRLARRVALARLTHRLTPRFLDALSPLPVLLPEAIGGPAPSAAAAWPAWQQQQQQRALSPLPASLRPLAAFLRARLTFKVVDNATYVFARPAAAATVQPQIQSIRAEIALVSLVYALPFGERLWHDVAEPAMGAAAAILEAAWKGFLKPLAAPWARSRLGYAVLEAL